MATGTGETAARDWGPALRAIPLGHTESVGKTVGESDVYLFAGITGDFSGVHVDEEFCKGTRFGRRIAHGALLVGFGSTVMARMTALLPPPGGVSSRYEVKFVAPVFIGDTVTTALTLVETRPERRELVFRARTMGRMLHCEPPPGALREEVSMPSRPELDRVRLGAALEAIVGPDGVLTEPDELLVYESDGPTSRRPGPRPW